MPKGAESARGWGVDEHSESGTGSGETKNVPTRNAGAGKLFPRSRQLEIAAEETIAKAAEDRTSRS